MRLSNPILNWLKFIIGFLFEILGVALIIEYDNAFLGTIILIIGSIIMSISLQQSKNKKCYH